MFLLPVHRAPPEGSRTLSVTWGASLSRWEGAGSQRASVVLKTVSYWSQFRRKPSLLSCRLFPLHPGKVPLAISPSIDDALRVLEAQA